MEVKVRLISGKHGLGRRKGVTIFLRCFFRNIGIGLLLCVLWCNEVFETMLSGRSEIRKEQHR